MRFPPRSSAAARRMARLLAPHNFEIQQAVSVHDLVENRIITINGKGEIRYAGE